MSKIVGSSWTHYIWQGSQVIAEHDAKTPLGNVGDPPYSQRSAKVDFIYAGTRLITTKQYTVSQQCTTDKNGHTTCNWVTTTAQNYYLNDRLSTRLVLDNSGNVTGRQAHLPFGEDFGESGTQEKHHFTSYERDGETSTDYAVNRQYAKSVGRFVQVDPLEGSINNPQSLNRYAYVQNDPTNRVDPMGLEGFLGWPERRPFECLIYPILCEPFPISEYEPRRVPQRPPRLYPGFSQGRLNILSTAKDGAIALLRSGSCKANLASKTIRGYHIDGDKLEQELFNLYMKPEGLDESEPGTEPFSGRTYNVFDGSASRLKGISELRGRDVGAVYELSYIFIFNVYFEPAKNPNARIGLDQTRALGLLHETIHLFDFRDEEFSANGKDKWGLQDFIIKSCIDPNYDHNDTAF